MFKRSISVMLLANSFSLPVQALPIAGPPAPNPCSLVQDLHEAGAIPYIAVLNCQTAISNQTTRDRSIAQFRDCDRYQQLHQAGAVSAQAMAEACGTTTGPKPTVAPKLTSAQAKEELAQLNEICLRFKVLVEAGAVPRIQLLNAVERYTYTLQQLGQTSDATSGSACRTVEH